MVCFDFIEGATGYDIDIVPDIDGRWGTPAGHYCSQPTLYDAWKEWRK